MSARFLQTQLLNTTVSAAVEYCIGLMIAWYFLDQNQFLYALLFMAAVRAVQLIVWIRVQFVSNLLYFVTGRQQLISCFESQLYQYAMPTFDGRYISNVDDYLSQVLADGSAAREQIMWASAIRGSIEVLREVLPSSVWRFKSTLGQALASYRSQRGRDAGTFRRPDPEIGGQPMLARRRPEPRDVGQSHRRENDDSVWQSEVEAARDVGRLCREALKVLVGLKREQLNPELKAEAWSRYCDLRDRAINVAGTLSDDGLREEARLKVGRLLEISGDAVAITAVEYASPASPSDHLAKHGD